MTQPSTSAPNFLLNDRRIFIVMLISLMVVAPLGLVRTSSAQNEPSGVQWVTGTMVTDNPYIISLTTEPYFALWDMTPYLNRDRSMAVPVESQIIAAPLGDLSEGQLSFKLPLPIAPLGTSHDLDDDDTPDVGVQIFSLEFAINMFGDPFASPAEFSGWGEALSSLIVTSPEGEVIGGQVLVWSPDGAQSFSSGLGPDGILLTDDDPIAVVAAGWTVVDLNADPFEFRRGQTEVIVINEGDDGYTDLSDRSFTDAFIALLDDLERRYAFTEEKGIDWAALRATYVPIVQKAQADYDFGAYIDALTLFGLEFPDGHVGGSLTQEFIDARIGGRLGMRLAETDDGEVIVITVTEGLPAYFAGIQVGATIVEWNGEDPTIAVNDAPEILSHSSPHAYRLFKYELMTRGPVGQAAQITFRNEDEEPQSVELIFSPDFDGRDAQINADLAVEDWDPLQLPIEMRMLDSGIAVIRINTFFADPIMMTSAWDTAIETLNAYGIPGLIIDIRDNGGGNATIPLYMAGSFYNEEFDLFDSELLNAEGTPIVIRSDTIYPLAPRYEFPIALIIDEGCASACELFAAAIARNPGNLIVGYNPTAGVEAGVRFYGLPGGIEFQASVLRVTLNGEVAIEGEGVPPNLVVPRTRENILNPDDELLLITEESLNRVIMGLFEVPMPESNASPEPTSSASPAALIPEACPLASPDASPLP